MTTGLYGKLPAHGDFVRRALPDGFVLPWDAWLQACIATAREEMGEAEFAAAWDAAPPWRFRLPPGACGTSAAAGVMVPSADMVGRRFPLTLAALLRDGSEAPAGGWYEALAAAGTAGRDGGEGADDVLAALPEAPWPAADAPETGWWLAADHRWDLPELPPPGQFRILLEGGA